MPDSKKFIENLSGAGKSIGVLTSGGDAQGRADFSLNRPVRMSMALVYSCSQWQIVTELNGASATDVKEKDEAGDAQILLHRHFYSYSGICSLFRKRIIVNTF